MAREEEEFLAAIAASRNDATATSVHSPKSGALGCGIEVVHTVAATAGGGGGDEGWEVGGGTPAPACTPNQQKKREQQRTGMPGRSKDRR